MPGTTVANMKTLNNTRAPTLIFQDQLGEGKWKLSAVTNPSTQNRELLFQHKINGEWVTGTKFIAPPV
jgi:hypothetical protein